jgi:molecular chaperone DnaK (HSP70)
VDLTRVDPAAPMASAMVKLTRTELAGLADNLVRRTFVVCDEVLREAGLGVKDLDALFVAGGATLLPVVRDGIQAYFGKPVEHAADPLQVVAIGASVLAAEKG